MLKQLFDQVSGTFTYLLYDQDSKEALLIDSVFEQHQRDLALIRELELKLIACVETHCHADHITGAWLLKHVLGSQIIASEQSGIHHLDKALKEGDTISFGKHSLRALSTPGHTDGCMSYVLDDNKAVFTGDSLLIRGCGRTDFQQGSAAKLFHSITSKLFKLPDSCIVYPAHDYNGRMSSSIAEEKQLNPRIGGDANEVDFTGFMENMRLPHPKKLDIAVPANLEAGRPKDDELPVSPDWAPVVSTYSGIQKVSPQWVAAHINDVHILDVRTRHELEEESIRLPKAQEIPIDELREHLSDIPKDKPVMTICRSGKRSVLAYSILKEAGFEKIANIDGGFLRWQQEGLPF